MAAGTDLRRRPVARKRKTGKNSVQLLSFWLKRNPFVVLAGQSFTLRGTQFAVVMEMIRSGSSL